MKKKLFMYFIIALFSFFIFLYAFIAIENYLVKAQDVINKSIEDKAIIIYEETIDTDGVRGKYLTNDGTIYTYSYASYGDKTLEEKLSEIKESTESKVEKITKKDKGYLSMFVGKLKNSAFKRTIKSDRPSKKIYYVDYDNNKTKIIISSGSEVMKNKSLSSSRIISMLKKYSIRVD